MENAADALYIAGAVFILLLALAVSMGSFTTVRAQFDNIIELDTTVDLAKDNDGSYIFYTTNTDKEDIRTVGIETVISSMYRVTKENYNLYIVLKNSIPGATNIIKTANQEQMYIDKDGNENQIINEGDNIIEVSIESGINSYKDIDKMLKANDDGYSLYDSLKGSSFKEYLGVYKKAAAEGVNSENQATFRVITYVQE